MRLFDRAGYRDPDQLLRSEASHIGGPDLVGYSNTLVKRYGSSIFGLALANAAEIIEPQDPLLGVDADYSRAKAFFRGSMYGMHVLARCVPENVKMRINRIEYEPEAVTGDNELDTRHRRAQAIIDLGDSGLGEVPELESTVEWLAEGTVPFIVDQPFVGSGFGLLIRHIVDAETALRHSDLIAMKDELDALTDDGETGIDALIKKLSV
jgi:hypothetical protein